MLISNGPTIQLFESANYFNRRSNLSSYDLKFTSEYLYYRNLKQRYQGGASLIKYLQVQSWRQKRQKDIVVKRSLTSIISLVTPSNLHLQ